MTVQQLINELEKAEDKSQIVQVIWHGVNCGEVVKVLQVKNAGLIYLQTLIADS